MTINKFPACTLILLLFSLWMPGCNGSRKDGKDRIKYRQYFVEGKRLYTKHCSNCHQANGEGLGRLYPPLKDSNHLRNMENFPGIVCALKYGQSGEIEVNGIIFNQPMPANPWLTDLEIAEILTYVYGTWGENEELFTHRRIRQVLDSCRNANPAY